MAKDKKSKKQKAKLQSKKAPAKKKKRKPAAAKDPVHEEHVAVNKATDKSPDDEDVLSAADENPDITADPDNPNDEEVPDPEELSFKK